jgi:hypothetical protein
LTTEASGKTADGRPVIQRKANVYRLYPTREQARQMAQIAGCCRFVYNWRSNSAATSIGPVGRSPSPASAVKSPCSGPMSIG